MEDCLGILMLELRRELNYKAEFEFSVMEKNIKIKFKLFLTVIEKFKQKVDRYSKVQIFFDRY